MRYKAKDIKTKGDHYKAIYEAIMMISWVTMSPPNGLPKQHVESQNGSCDFNLNRVLKNNKDDDTKNWIKSLKALNKKICEYVKEYFKSSGLTYNAKGGSIADAATETKSAPKSEEKEAGSAKTTKKAAKPK